ncbi:SecDF P1 head subdomain-containing protein [Alcaligenes sp. SJTW-7]|uniref:SecDF P1 head subdomain-containing protein n=1 Tax=Alcaligenes sp. SJTW-7 TaxID=3078429 RepID=UPI0039EAB25F
MDTRRRFVPQIVRAAALGALCVVLAGCQHTRGAGGADLSPPTLAGTYEREGDDGTRSFLASQTSRALQYTQMDFYVGMPQAVPGLVQVEGPEGPLWLYPQVIVQRSDLTRVASVRTAQGDHLLRFHLNALGTRKLAEVSAGNVGALLVLVMDDQVAHVARIAQPLKQGMIYLAVPDAIAAQRFLSQVQG